MAGSDRAKLDRTTMLDKDRNVGGALSGLGTPKGAPVVSWAHPVHSHPLTWAELVPLVTGDGNGPVGTVCHWPLSPQCFTPALGPRAAAHLPHAPRWV